MNETANELSLSAQQMHILHALHVEGVPVSFWQIAALACVYRRDVLRLLRELENAGLVREAEFAAGAYTLTSRGVEVCEVKA